MNIKNSLIVLSFALIPGLAISEPPMDVENESHQATEKTIEQPLIEETGFSRGKVARAVFTRDVFAHEPVDNLSQISNDIPKVIFFTELRNMSGHKVKHRWEYNGNLVSEVEYAVRGPRWRVWSSKNMLPTWLGHWTVSVINTEGEVIETREFEYVQTTAQSTQ